MQTEINDNAYIQKGFQAIADAARLISADVAEEVDQVLKAGRNQPLTHEEADHLLEKAIVALRNGASRRNDTDTLDALGGDIKQVITRIMQANQQTSSVVDSNQGHFLLVEHDGFKPRPVFPTPHLLGLDVPMWEGFIKTTDIKPWNGNPRLDIHLAQFKSKYARDPEPDELLAIMRSEASLPGVPQGDEFKIKELAKDIATNGVKVPPTLDKDGTLVDGNRRVASCYLILASTDKDFAPEEKQRVRYIFARQLSAHTSASHRQAVVIGINFPPDYRKEWPYYVKARMMYDAWQDMLAAEFRPPSNQRKNQMKKELAAKFAVDVSEVKRYVDMVELANEFEQYHIAERVDRKDEHIVRHHANEQFQYFDELNKGVNPGGVYHTLNQDEAFKHLVFDLLFDGKFNNWREIRALRHVHNNQEAMELLKKAREEQSHEHAKDLVEKACGIAQEKDALNRVLGANTRIDVFAKWLSEVPIAAFSDEDQVTTTSLKRLHDCFKIVEKQVLPILNERGITK